MDATSTESVSHATLAEAGLMESPREPFLDVAGWSSGREEYRRWSSTAPRARERTEVAVNLKNELRAETTDENP